MQVIPILCLLYRRIIRVYIAIPSFYLILRLIQSFILPECSILLSPSKIFINFRYKSTLLEVLIHLILLLPNHLLDLMLLPNMDALQKGRIATSEIPFVGFDDGVEGALDVDSILAVFVFLPQQFFRLEALPIKLLPDGLFGLVLLFFILITRSLKGWTRFFVAFVVRIALSFILPTRTFLVSLGGVALVVVLIVVFTIGPKGPVLMVTHLKIIIYTIFYQHAEGKAPIEGRIVLYYLKDGGSRGFL